MSSKKNFRKTEGELRKVVAFNVRDLMDKKYALSSNKPKALSLDAGCSFSSVQRILKAETGGTVETIEMIARALGIPTWHLFIPDERLTTFARQRPTAEERRALHQDSPPYVARKL